MAERSRLFFVRHIVRKIFLEDWAMKLTALAITFGLWFGVTGLSTPTTKRFSSVPLEISGPNNSEITSPQTEIDIVLSGDKRRLDQINKAELTANIDVTDMPPGDRLVSLMPENVSLTLPSGIKLVEVSPIRILVRLETIEEKEVIVKPVTTAEPASGFEVYSTTVLPQKVRVRGPAAFIRSLESIETDGIDLANRRDGFTARQIPVRVSESRASVQNPFVDVDFRIGEKRVERRFSMPVGDETNRTARFVLFGPRTPLGKLKSEDVKMQMYLDDAGELRPRVVLPEEISQLVEVRDLVLEP